MISLSGSPLDGGSANFSVDKYPDECPICHTSAYPKLLTAVISGVSTIEWAQLALQCTKRTCLNVFIARYRLGSESGRPTQMLQSVVPIVPSAATYSEVITNTSSAFVEISNQALAAEASGLDQLTGIGLRKALEFLVKDFAVTQQPDQKDDIESSLLGPCISKYIDDPNVKACAKRATWLGNDETHYIRRWEEHDIEDLKRLIRLTVNWIENVILTKQYLAEMPEGGPA